MSEAQSKDQPDVVVVPSPNEVAPSQSVLVSSLAFSVPTVVGTPTVGSLPVAIAASMPRAISIEDSVRIALESTASPKKRPRLTAEEREKREAERKAHEEQMRAKREQRESSPLYINLLTFSY